MSRKSRKHRNRGHRPIERMSVTDTYDFADALDLSDGATFAMAAEMAGMDYGDFMDELAASALEAGR